jgi:energy-coupling factor transporter ATP-binding protein EcfA2
MTIDRLTLENFTVFEQVDLSFAPGINVFLGANGTGKSHAMKVMYATVKGLEQASPDQSLTAWTSWQKLTKVFTPADPDPRLLVSTLSSAQEAKVRLKESRFEFDYSIAKTDGSWGNSQRPIPGRLASTFPPSREMLSTFTGFIALYARRELVMDETYNDVCLALSLPPLRSEHQNQIRELTEPLEDAFGGRVALLGDRFYVETPSGEVGIHLLAEGWRKLAMVAWLIRNGSIAPGTALFWDEPEAGLNPSLVTLVVDLLEKLAAMGVQIFVATHDFLLSQRLSLLAEYGQTKAAIRFHLFHRPGVTAPAEVSSGATLAELPESPVRSAFLRHYDFEQKLFFEDGNASAPE